MHLSHCLLDLPVGVFQAGLDKDHLESSNFDLLSTFRLVYIVISPHNAVSKITVKDILYEGVRLAERQRLILRLV